MSTDNKQTVLTEIARDPTKCVGCGGFIPPERQCREAEYCSTKCYNHARYKRRITRNAQAAPNA